MAESPRRTVGEVEPLAPEGLPRPVSAAYAPDKSSGQVPALGVILPTYNRASALQACLQHLEAQTVRDFELVVVDDGSTDGTERLLREYLQRTPLAVRCVRQANSGPARARNRGIALLRAPVCLMLGDDIFASSRLVETHLRLHTEHAEANVAGLGLTRWSEQGQTVTPFMRWLDEGGIQFAYDDLLGGTKPDWRHFYTSNLSLKTRFLRENPFDEGFREAAMEDIELGYRLWKRHGLQIEFLPAARAEHLHPTSVDRACRRMQGVGAATYRFAQLWPEHSPKFPVTSGWRRGLRDSGVGSGLAIPLLRLGASLLTRFQCPNPMLRKAMAAHYALGYRRAAAGLPG